jgi:hypothetical protein
VDEAVYRLATLKAPATGAELNYVLARVLTHGLRAKAPTARDVTLAAPLAAKLASPALAASPPAAKKATAATPTLTAELATALGQLQNVLAADGTTEHAIAVADALVAEMAPSAKHDPALAASLMGRLLHACDARSTAASVAMPLEISGDRVLSLWDSEGLDGLTNIYGTRKLQPMKSASS